MSGIASGATSHGRLELGFELELLAALEQRPRAGAVPRDGQVARVDPGFQAATRELRQQLRGRLIEAPAREVRRTRSAGARCGPCVSSGRSETFGYTSSSKQANRHH